MGPVISRAVGSASWRRYLAVPAGLLLILTVASPSPPPHLRVLVLSGRNNHAWQETTPALKGVYEASGRFTYTNAGHLPPLVVRKGSVERLDVNGMVVGAFPMARYDESHVELNSGDLLVFFTDGISEPENAYGEMFGEDRLAELISRHAHLGEDQIIEAVWNGVREWSGDGELADDMTLLLARKL